MKRVFEYDFQGRKLVIEHGELAKQAGGAVLVRYDDTVILSTCVMSSNVSTADFFPLTILYQEKLYSVGKIPGGFIKREGRPTDEATLTARVIDRPIRPMFDENFRNEVQVVNTVLSVDPDRTPEMTALFGPSNARYEATRGCWRISMPNIETYPYVLSVTDGLVKEVYRVNEWHVKGERKEFTGVVAPDEIRNHFIGKRIPDYYSKKGMASPVLYSK